MQEVIGLALGTPLGRRGKQGWTEGEKIWYSCKGPLLIPQGILELGWPLRAALGERSIFAHADQAKGLCTCIFVKISRKFQRKSCPLS